MPRTTLEKESQFTVHDSECPGRGLDLGESTTKDHADDTLQRESESLSPLPAHAVHEDTANDASGKVEGVDQSAPADVLDNCIVRVDLANDGGAEQAERVRAKVVYCYVSTRLVKGERTALTEPAGTRADDAEPVSSESQRKDLQAEARTFHGVLTVRSRVEHLNP
jgi:hypothetical protein